jgi:hypothetical protein
MTKKAKKLLILFAENFIEFGRLSFAGFVIGGILSDSPNKILIIAVGAACSVTPILAGILMKTKTYLEED